MMPIDDFEGEFNDNALKDFDTYEQYLDKQITPEDLKYLEDIELARQLKEQGHNSKTEISGYIILSYLRHILSDINIHHFKNKINVHI